MRKAPLLFVLALVPAVSFAKYVSPSEYKDLSCEELAEEHDYVSSEALDALLESVDRMGTRAGSKASEEHDELEAHSKAMYKAGLRKDCAFALELKERKDSSDK